MNTKGDIPSILFAIIIIFVAGVILLITSNLTSQIYQGFDDYFDTSKYNGTEAHQALNTVQEYENSMWDYVFLAITIGYILMLIILGFSTQISVVFYFIYGIVAMVGLFAGVALSNTWEKMVETDALSGTVARFPITDAILNNFFPLFITVVIVITMIMLFGKSFLPGGEEIR